MDDAIEIPFDTTRTPRDQIVSAVAAIPPTKCKRHPHVTRQFIADYTVDDTLRGIHPPHLLFNITFHRCSKCPYKIISNEKVIANCAVGPLRLFESDCSQRDADGTPVPHWGGSANLVADQVPIEQLQRWLVKNGRWWCVRGGEALTLHTSTITPTFESLIVQPRFMICPQCRLEFHGVSPDNSFASFDNLIVDLPTIQQHLDCCRAFAANPEGTLLMLGNCGTIKTHLAIAILRERIRLQAMSLRFVKHRHFLSKCRRAARPFQLLPECSPLDCCQNVGLLVYDELTPNDGAADYEDTLLDLFESRSGNHRPTIITANICREQLESAIGSRLFDRLRRASRATLDFGLESA